MTCTCFQKHSKGKSCIKNKADDRKGYSEASDEPGGTIARARALLSSSSAAFGLISFKPCPGLSDY